MTRDRDRDGSPFARGPLGALARAIGRGLDLATEAGLRLAMIGLTMIVAAYVWEVLVRYAFEQPTRWSADLVSYLLLFVTFMALPQVTREGGHVAVTVLLERLPPAAHRGAVRAIALAGAVVCVWMAHLALDETTRQVARDVRMMAAWPVPKAWISVWIVFGFGLSACHFARVAVRGESPRPSTSV